MPETLKLMANDAQIDHWNAVAGNTWAQFHELLDSQIEGLGLAAINALEPTKGEQVLDIGCGCGQTSLALADRVGSAGSVVGVDISAPMLEVALHRSRAYPSLAVTFRQVDAQTDDLGRGLFDAAFSRFGVLFSDPEAAFANIRKSLKPGGRLVFIWWRSLAENPWMQAPLLAALPFIPPVGRPIRRRLDRFRLQHRVRGILANAGFRSVAINPLDARIG
jgi:ubiquinone/menaquinone biosynthesis C-methylase UbiE